MDFDDIKSKVAEHKDQIDKGLEKAGGLVKGKLHHDNEVDEGVEKAKDAIDRLNDDAK